MCTVFMMTIGIIWMSCENSPSKGGTTDDDAIGNVQGPGLIYKKITVTDGIELMNYLSSPTTPYEITLNMADQNIFMSTDLSIIMPMKLIGAPDKNITIHTSNSEKVPSYFSLEIRENVELQYCNIKLYDINTLDNGVELPPLVIMPETTLTVGKGAGLIFDNYPYSTAYSGGTVKVYNGGKFIDNSVKGGKIFDCGISYLIIDKTGTANLKLGPNNTVGDQETDLFQIVDGSFGMSRIDDETGYIVDGTVKLNNDWTLPNDQFLHIKSGKLVVTEGKTLFLTRDMAALTLDANIELSQTAGLDLSENVAEVLEKIIGSGYIAVEDGTGSIYEGGIAFIGSDEGVFVPLNNSRIVVNGAGVTLTKGEAQLTYTRGTYDLKTRFIVTAGTRLIIPSGTFLRAPLINKLEGTAATRTERSRVTVMDGAALMVYPGDEPFYYPDIPSTSLPIELEWDNASAKWVMIMR